MQYLEVAASNVVEGVEPVTGNYTFTTRAGVLITSFPESTLTATHDYFIVQILKDPLRGALVVSVSGIGWQGTPAAVAYFNNALVTELASTSRSFNDYLMVEWTDNGDGVKGMNDTFTVLARDVP